MEPDHAPQREPGNLRAELLAAASELASLPRPAAIPSLRSVARSCGVSPTAIYRYFPSQSALAQAMLTAYDEAFTHAVIAADEPDQPPRQRLQRLGNAYVDWALEYPGFYQLLFESADQLGADYTLPGSSDELMRRVTHLLQLCAPPPGAELAGEPRTTGEDLWVSLHGIASLRIHKPGQQWTVGHREQVSRLLSQWVGP